MSEQTKQMFNHRSGLSAKVFARSVSQPLGEIRYHHILLMLVLILMTMPMKMKMTMLMKMLHKSPTANCFSSYLSSQQKPTVTQRRESSLVDLKHMEHLPILQWYKAGPGLWFDCEQE